FTTGFDEGLKALKKAGHEAHFKVAGNLYGDEVIVGVSLLFGEKLAATTAYASADFDPHASSPTLEDLLSACVDGLGTLFGTLMDPKYPAKLEQLAGDSLGDLDGIPFQWSPVEINKRTIHLRMDKANPVMDQAAEEWLAKNDPDYGKRQAEEAAEAEELVEERVEDAQSGKKPTFH
ncbi:MAG TPA: hypothetical protein VL588_03820, partial [Bdellovibrionota bacterium]|nr:hypothetical protein [Bdellovibrionota bacterium]